MNSKQRRWRKRQHGKLTTQVDRLKKNNKVADVYIRRVLSMSFFARLVFLFRPDRAHPNTLLADMLPAKRDATGKHVPG